MQRIVFQRSPSGFRSPQGELIKRLQRTLHDKGFYNSIIDGDYGGKTEQALQAFQQSNNLPATGRVDDDTWRMLTNTDIPTLQERCLQLTGDFEGTGFTKIVGNFDGAGLTWGIIGFTLVHGELQRILARIKKEHPEVYAAAFGALAAEMDGVLKSSLSKQMLFANQISVGTRKVKVLDQWAAAFAALGSNPDVQAIQIENTGHYFDIAERDANRFQLKNELGFGLCFDIAVQNGGIDQTETSRIQQKLEQTLPTTEQDIRIIVANVVAENSNPRFIEDVRKRKMTFATGIGVVHESRYTIKSWGLDELPR